MSRFEEDTKMFEELYKYRVKCKCSHVITIKKLDRAICNHCGEWVYRTPELQFKYKMKEVLKKEEANDNEIRQIRQIRNA